MKHLVFYDGECGFCDMSVQFLLNIDSAELFAFAPLQGSTAKELLSNQLQGFEPDTLVLIENYQSKDSTTYIYAQAVFRICWLLGGWWRLIGWLCFFPPFLFNWAYRLFARHRYLFGRNVCHLPDRADKERFLP